MGNSPFAQTPYTAPAPAPAPALSRRRGSITQPFNTPVNIIRQASPSYSEYDNDEAIRDYTRWLGEKFPAKKAYYEPVSM